MPKRNSSFFMSLVLGAIVLVALNIFWFKWRPHFTLGSTWSVALFSDSSRLHGILSSFLHWRDLEQENADLHSQLDQDIADRAEISDLEKQNEQLKKALNLNIASDKAIIPAGIYNIDLAPTGYTALINKGSSDEVSVGNIVVGDHKELIGMIAMVFADYSKVTLVSDPSFKVTAQVLGGQAKGIAHGALDKGMTLDLVVQSDQIQQGDTLVSSGNDQVPGGLVIGGVNHVDSNTAKLFKLVTVTPNAQFMSGDVYILK